MKTLEHVSFNEKILIPAKSKFQGPSPFLYYVGDIQGSNENASSNINVIFFNCNNVGEIPSLVEAEITGLNEYFNKNPEKKEKLSGYMNFFLKLKEEVSDKILTIHEPPKNLLLHISEAAHLPELKKEEVIFISGVSAIVEV